MSICTNTQVWSPNNSTERPKSAKKTAADKSVAESVAACGGPKWPGVAGGGDGPAEDTVAPLLIAMENGVERARKVSIGTVRVTARFGGEGAGIGAGTLDNDARPREAVKTPPESPEAAAGVSPHHSVNWAKQTVGFPAWVGSTTPAWWQGPKEQ